MNRKLIAVLVVLVLAVVASGTYIYRLHRRTQENVRRAAAAKPQPPPVAGAEQSIRLTVASDSDGKFQTREVSSTLPTDDEARGRAILQALLDLYERKDSPHEIAQGSAVNTVFIVGQKLAVIDLNGAFADGHRSGIMAEDMSLMSLIETLSSNLPQIEQARFLVDGKPRETLAGHSDLLSTYSTQSVHRLVEQAR